MLDVLFISGSTENQNYVRKFAPEWSEYANVDFIFHTSRNTAEKIDIMLEIQEVDESKGLGGRSYIGSDSRLKSDQNSPSMHLYFSSSTDTATKKGLILHEFGHALGLVHEHQHPERNFEYDLEAILKYCEDQMWSESECYKHKIDKFESLAYDYFTYDPRSIMHYQMHDNYIKSSEDPEIFKYVRGLSLLDKIAISQIYPGRISLSDIYLKHSQHLQYVMETNEFEACHIKEYITSEGAVTFLHKLKSVPLYKLGLFYPLEDKHDAIINMLHDPKCKVETFEDAFNDLQDVQNVER